MKKRHEELLALRNDNAHRERRFYGASADKEIDKEPVYDVKVLDAASSPMEVDAAAGLHTALAVALALAPLAVERHDEHAFVA